MTTPIEHVARAAEMWRSADKNAISAKGDEKNIAGHQFFLATRALRLAIDIYISKLSNTKA